MRGDDLSEYAAGRWPVVVRMLVLLGAPPAYAEELAVTAVGRFLARAGDDSWLDLDVVLVAETIEAWETDRTAWWLRASPPDDGLTGELETLDPLTPARRARLVAAAVAGLTSDQLDEVLGPDPTGRARPDLATLADAVPVGEARVEAARAAAERPVRAGRRLALAGLVLGLGAAAALTWAGVRAVDPQPDPTPSSGTSPDADLTTLGTEAPGDDRPGLSVPWYDGADIHLPDRTVGLPAVTALARAEDGVVATYDDGRVAHVRGDGTVVGLGRTASDEVAIADRGLASWVDVGTGEVVVQILGGGDSQVAVGAGARVVAVDGPRVFVETAAGSAVVTARPRGTSGLRGIVGRRTALLDVSATVRVARRLDGLLEVAPPTGGRFEVAGDGAVLSDEGRYLAVRSGTTVTLVDVERGVSLPLPIGANPEVADAAFDEDEALVIALRRGPSQVPDGFGDEDIRPGYDLVTCVLPEAECQVRANTYDLDRPPLLAH